MPTVGKAKVNFVFRTYFEIPKAIERPYFSTFGFVWIQVTRRPAQLGEQTNSYQKPQTHDSRWLAAVHRCILYTETELEI